MSGSHFEIFTLAGLFGVFTEQNIYRRYVFACSFASTSSKGKLAFSLAGWVIPSGIHMNCQVGRRPCRPRYELYSSSPSPPLPLVFMNDTCLFWSGLHQVNRFFYIDIADRRQYSKQYIYLLKKKEKGFEVKIEPKQIRTVYITYALCVCASPTGSHSFQCFCECWILFETPTLNKQD